MIRHSTALTGTALEAAEALRSTKKDYQHYTELLRKTCSVVDKGKQTHRRLTIGEIGSCIFMQYSNTFDSLPEAASDIIPKYNCEPLYPH